MPNTLKPPPWADAYRHRFLALARARLAEAEAMQAHEPTRSMERTLESLSAWVGRLVDA